MNDEEIKQAVIALCETVRASLNFYSDINRSVIALSNTIFENNPSLKLQYDKHWDRVEMLSSRSLGPDMSELFAKIDALIQGMKK